MASAILAIIILTLLLVVIWKLAHRANKRTEQKPDASEIAPDDHILIDEAGRRYKLVTRTLKTEKRTYLKGTFTGKFRTEINQHLKHEFLNEKHFDIKMYEGEFSVIQISSGPLKNSNPLQLPKGFLPTPLYCRIPGTEKVYEISLQDPEIEYTGREIDRHYYQDEGEETFGTFQAILYGHISEVEEEKISERQYLEDEETPKNTTPRKTNVPTGNVEHSGNYSRQEFYYDNFRDTYWEGWRYSRDTRHSALNNEGCAEAFISILGIIALLVFFLSIVPQLGIIALLFIIPFAIRMLGPVLKWIFQAIAGVLLLFAILAIAFGGKDKRYDPAPVTDRQDEIKIEEIKRDSTGQPDDTLVRHHRVWEDYDGVEYSGDIWVRKSDMERSNSYKKHLPLEFYDENSYRQIVGTLMENDSTSLEGVYELFDSLRASGHYDREQFAKIIVSFVQDIPYALVLTGPCDRSYYDDPFVRSYLESKNAICCDYQRYGINTPVEFMGNLLGDCDTRTLCLYTILSHYGYDVALLSSELYAHSLLGINLPIEGSAYRVNETKYVLWETTSAGIPPGVISRDISDLTNWSITLKSK